MPTSPTIPITDDIAVASHIDQPVITNLPNNPTTEGVTMPATTTVINELSDSFDLVDAVAAKFPGLSEEDRFALAVSIERDARTYRDENLPPDCPNPAEVLAAIQQQMLDSLVKNRKPVDNQNVALPSWRGSSFDLVAGIAEAVPCLTHEDAKLVAPFVYRALERRVGEKLTEGMPDELLDEFGAFVEQNEAGMASWFEANLPGYESRADFQALVTANPDAEPLLVLSEYGAMQWLQRNRPDYPEVVLACKDLIMTAFQDAVIEAGDDLENWLRFRRIVWKWVFNQADTAEEIMTCVAVIAYKEGPEVFGRWAQVQLAFDSLAGRAAALVEEAGR